MHISVRGIGIELDGVAIVEAGDDVTPFRLGLELGAGILDGCWIRKKFTT